MADPAPFEHRVFGLEIGRRLGAGVPGAAWVASMEEAMSWFDAGMGRCGEADGRVVEASRDDSPVSRDFAWVAKHPLSAAGRQRIRGHGRPEADQRRRLARLFDVRGGGLLLEPWLRRMADFGLSGLVEEMTPSSRGPWFVGIHEQLVDDQGRFVGARVARGEEGLSLRRGERQRLLEAGLAVARALHRGGYRGPFSVDAFRFATDAPATDASREGRDVDDAGIAREARVGEGFVAICEVNARCTFGLVAHALARRAMARDRKFRTCTLHLGRQPAPCSRGEKLVTLLEGAASDGTGAWLRLSR